MQKYKAKIKEKGGEFVGRGARVRRFGRVGQAGPRNAGTQTTRGLDELR